MKNTPFTRRSQVVLASMALTGLLAGSAARAATTSAPSGGTQLTAGQLADDASMGKHDCKGQNSCKGQGGCKTGDNGCKGQNTCKGKGGCKTNTSA